MKRRIALFMVLAMLISLVPMNVFAASKNTATTVPSVAKDTIFVQGGADTPNLRLEEGSTAEWAGTKTFELQLTNCEWAGPNPVVVSSNTPAGQITWTVTTKSDANATVTYTVNTVSSAAVKYFADIPMLVKATGGEAKVEVIARDSAMSSGTVLVAIAGDGATKASIASVKSFADTVTLDTIKIDELIAGTLTGTGVKTLELTLPANYEFTNALNGTFTVNGGAGWVTNPVATVSALDTDLRKAQVQFNLTTNNAERGVLYISGLGLKKTSDASEGDVTLKIKQLAATAEVTEETITVAKYVPYTVTVKAMADPVTLYAGRYEAANGEDDAQKLVKLNIKEEVVGAWLANRITKIQFNDEVKVLGYNIKKNDNISGGSIKTDAGNVAVAQGYNACVTTNRSYVEISGATIAATKKADVEIQFYVSVKRNYEGDIKATVSGEALNKSYEVVLGKAVKQAAITATLKDVKLGLKNQPIGDIVITEPAKAVWEYGTADNVANTAGSENGANNYVLVTLDSPFSNGFVWNTDPVVKVTKGNVTIGKVTSNGAVLTIPIKVESSVPAELTLSGGTIDVDRNLPEGKYDVLVGGGAMVDNKMEAENKGMFKGGSVVSAQILNIITPAPGDTKTIEKVVFTIDAMDYMVGANKVTADVAPYINEQGRTMLPLRALANALNVSNDNIVWNESDRSVVIFKGDSTIKVVIGEMSFTKNGTVVGMDTMATIKNGRTMLPLRAIGQALGFTPVWDEATRTVTVQ